jgi:hypothetical protein
MNKIIKTLVFISSLAFGQQAFAAACSDEPITDTSTCHAIPDTYTITLYEMGLCNDISEQSSTVPDIVTSCQTAFLNSTGSTVNVENNVTGSLSGGTSTRPDDNTYSYGFIKVDAKMIMQNQSTFSEARNDGNVGVGTTCWTNGIPFNGGGLPTTTCGNEVDANPQNMVADITGLGCSGGEQGMFYCRYESDPEGLDSTYAWLVDANGNASTNGTYSETAGHVKYLIGIAKFNEPKTVSNASTGMQAQFVVTRALSVGFSDGNRVNYGLNEFKVLTEITTD